MHIHMAMVIRQCVQTAFWELKLMMCEIKAKLISLSTTLRPESSKIALKWRIRRLKAQVQ